ncbi:hypothetical protein [Pseudomonas citronellolis]|uniref:hypothetical protein n=1 Tax=Pseudomonas citronellolis TaxID=53408 RepID=UPI00248E92CC|nr:hypothetical protein [Pseudomonas citronellolis]
MKLNGWQRLWVVVIVIWGVVLVGAGTYLFNITSGRYEDYLAELDAVERLPDTAARNIQRQIIEDEYREDVKPIITTKKRVAVGFPLVWLASSAALYALGWGVAWIIRGFKKPT